MGWQPHLLYPSIYRVLVDAEMRSYILDPDPSFFSGHFIPLRQFSVRCLRTPTKPDISIHNWPYSVKDKRRNSGSPEISYMQGFRLGLATYRAPSGQVPLRMGLKLRPLGLPTYTHAKEACPEILTGTRTRR
jgi:hypothetical protein